MSSHGSGAMMTSEIADPELGILSRTINSSSAVKWIVPAKIRSASKNDVVFVGDTSIQLREFLDNGQLADAIVKLDLPTQILAAKTISAQLVVTPLVDAVLNQCGEEESWTINDRPIDDGMPPQILILTLASSDLLYLYAKESDAGNVNFCFAKRPLLHGVSLPQRHCKHLAVDPDSRALAVASASGRFAVFSLKRVDEIKNEIDKWSPLLMGSFAPSLEQRWVQTDGFIVKMEFLPSTEIQPDKIILVLLVANEGETRLLLYEWDSKLPLYKLKPMRCSGQLLPIRDSVPLLFIPSAVNTSFTLITETELVLYDDVTTKRAKRIGIPLYKQDEAHHLITKTPPLCTQWAKPKRHSKQKGIMEDLFLFREDGVLLIYLINYTLSSRIQASFSPGSLNIKIDTAVCALAGLPGYGGDVIIAGGSMMDGGVFLMLPRQDLKLAQTLTSLCPVQDMILVGPQSLPNDRANTLERVFVCYGSENGQGCVAELHIGYAAQIGWTVPLEDAGSIRALWTLEAECAKELWLLVSHPLYTSLYVFDLTRQEAPESTDALSHPGVDFDSPTVTAAILDGQYVLQITSTDVNIIPVGTEYPPDRISFEGRQCLCADISEQNHTLVIGHTTASAFGITLFRISLNPSNRCTLERVQESLQLASRPVSICSCKVRQVQVIVLSTDSGDLYGYHTDNGLGLIPLFAISLQNLGAQLKNISTNSLALLAGTYSNYGLLLCGLRDGRLICIELCVAAQDDELRIDLRLDATVKIGLTAVSVSKEHYRCADSSSALVQCESALHRISLTVNAAGADYETISIWLSSQDDLSAPQPILNAVTRIQPLRSVQNDDRSGLLVCVTQEEILFSSLTFQSQAVIRQSKFAGVPRRIAYSRYLKHLVVAVAEANTPLQLPFGDSSSSPYDRPHIRFSEVDKSSSEAFRSLEGTVVAIGEPGEQIRALLNWTPTDGSTHYEMIVVALNKENSGITNKSGKVIVLSASKVLKGIPTDMKPRTLLSFSGKSVTALCPLGKSSLLIGNSTEIVLHHLDIGSRKWSTICKHTLPSAPLSIYSQGSLVFVATMHHSLLILRENKNALNFYAADDTARNSNNVIAFKGTTTVLSTISDRGSNLIAFAEDKVSSALYKVFTASTPLPVERLQQDRKSISRGATKQSFHASTLDGTLYHLTTLQPDEWKLLDFLEGLCHFDQRPKKQPPKTKAVFQGLISEPTRINPAAMHIRGDILRMMIEPSPYNLRNLLEPSIKLEDEHNETDERSEMLNTLRTLAEPLVGEKEDIIGAVTIWIRKLLQYPMTF